MNTIQARVESNQKRSNHIQKWVIRIALFLLVSITLESLGISIDTDTIPVIFSIIGIIVPIAVSVSLSFPFDSIDNQDYVNDIRKDTDYVIKCFIVLLAISAIVFIKPYPDKEFSFNIINFSLFGISDLFIVSVLLYYCINFIDLMRIRNSLSDRLRKSRLEEKERNNG